MNVIFKAMMCKKWGLNGNTFIYGKKEYPVSEIRHIHLDTIPKNSGFNGLISITLPDGKEDTLGYAYKDIDNAKAACEYIAAHSRAGEEAARRQEAARLQAEHLKTEYRMRCNVCGQITCFTGQDMKDNEMAKAMAGLTAMGTAASAFTGNFFVQSEQNKRQDSANAKVRDFEHCPHCGSGDVTIYDEKQWAEAQAQPAPAPAVSAAAELKQLKELLDMGILSAEEFDAKKKQLLGL